jgi:4'-phosphopantetheinyl transferase EntD
MERGFYPRIGTPSGPWHTLSMPTHAPALDMTKILDELFPPGVATVLSLSPDISTPLGPGELHSAARFVPARLAEFSHGRACARRALARIGRVAADIPAGANREPLWPAGVVGSITHAAEAAAAVVAREADFMALGLDLEPESPLDAELVPRICLPREVELILGNAADPGHAAKRVFSMKEAAYKAIWPVLRLVLDFHDIEIQLGGDDAKFAVVSRSDRCPADLAARIVGRSMSCGRFFAAGAAIQAR